MQNVDDLQDERKVYRTTTDLESISEQSQWVTIKPLLTLSWYNHNDDRQEMMSCQT